MLPASDESDGTRRRRMTLGFVPKVSVAGEDAIPNPTANESKIWQIPCTLANAVKSMARFSWLDQRTAIYSNEFLLISTSINLLERPGQFLGGKNNARISPTTLHPLSIVGPYFLNARLSLQT
jgi:hypothetical protein